MWTHTRYAHPPPKLGQYTVQGRTVKPGFASPGSPLLTGGRAPQSITASHTTIPKTPGCVNRSRRTCEGRRYSDRGPKRRSARAAIALSRNAPSLFPPLLDKEGLGGGSCGSPEPPSILPF